MGGQCGLDLCFTENIVLNRSDWTKYSPRSRESIAIHDAARDDAIPSTRRGNVQRVNGEAANHQKQIGKP